MRTFGWAIIYLISRKFNFQFYSKISKHPKTAVPLPAVFTNVLTSTEHRSDYIFQQFSKTIFFPSYMNSQHLNFSSYNSFKILTPIRISRVMFLRYKMMSDDTWPQFINYVSINMLVFFLILFTHFLSLFIRHWRMTRNIIFNSTRLIFIKTGSVFYWIWHCPIKSKNKFCEKKLFYFFIFVM